MHKSIIDLFNESLNLLKMKFYQLHTVFNFGKHKGKNLQEIIRTNPSYVNWCSIHLDHFYVSDNTVNQMKNINPHFALSKEALNILNEKYEEWEYDHEPTQNNDDYTMEDTFAALLAGTDMDLDDFRDECGNFNGDINDLMTWSRG